MSLSSTNKDWGNVGSPTFTCELKYSLSVVLQVDHNSERIILI